MPRKPAADRKAQIIACCLDLADRMGPARITTNDIARAVGLTQPGIFRHFPTKQALWLAVAEAATGRMVAAWAEALAATPEPEDRLRALVTAQLRQIEATPALPMILTSRELNADDPALGALMRDRQAVLMGHLRAAFARMQAAGRLRPGLAADEATQLLVALIQGLAIRWSLGAREVPLVATGLRMFETQLALMRAEAAEARAGEG